MIRVLQIRETPLTKCAGVDANCQALIELFAEDEEIEMLPTVDYTRHTIPIIKQYYLDEKEICDSIETLKPDIIHIHVSFSLSLWAAAKCAKKYNLPIVLSPHFHPFYSLKRPRMGCVFFHIITRRVLKDVDLVFNINKEDSAQFKKYHKNVVTVPHWSKFEPSMIEVKKNPRMILFVGRIDESNKGVEHLYKLPEGKYEIHCVGKGNRVMRSDMTHHVNISEEELQNLYMKASLLVVPSRYEAFSYVSIEALMCNTPIVISDRVRIGDYLEGMESVGVFKYHDYADFNRKVEQTIGKQVDREKVREIFTPERIKQIYKEAYKKVYEKHISTQ